MTVERTPHPWSHVGFFPPHGYVSSGATTQVRCGLYEKPLEVVATRLVTLVSSSHHRLRPEVRGDGTSIETEVASRDRDSASYGYTQPVRSPCMPSQEPESLIARQRDMRWISILFPSLMICPVLTVGGELIPWEIVRIGCYMRIKSKESRL